MYAVLLILISVYPHLLQVICRDEGSTVLSLDPWSDPHGAYLHLDFLAIKCAMYSWLSSFYAIFSPASSETPDHSSDLEEPRSDYPPVCALPGWAYARALAFRAGGDDQASQVRPSVSVDKRPSEAD